MVRSLIGKQLGNPFRSRACWRTSTSSSTCSRSGGSNVACFTSSSPDNNPWKVAIVGSGPSGCYTAKYLLHTSKQDESFHIDILDRLPTAYGLVRNGVAPDHPEVKNVQHDFDSMMMHTKSSSAGDDESSSSSSSTIQFYGNVHVGKDVSLEELRSMYDMVVLAYGCESDRVLNLPGSSSDNHLKGILSAREFVAWYNGHVDFEWVGPVVKEALSSSSSSSSGGNQNIVVLGHGNVALDCARILAKSRDELDPTDIATRALEILDPMDQEDNIERTISIVGRRGHIQGAFTIKELRELTKLPHADFVVRSDELEMGLSSEASQEELKGSRPRTRMDKLLMEAASKENNNTKTRRVNLRFLLNPARFEAAEGDPSKLARIVCERTQLVGDAGAQRAVGTGEEESIDAQLVRERKYVFLKA
jgi:adrenodoxin-NADP+ reductase